MKKKLILMLSVALFAVCLLAIAVSAAEVDGIYYELKGSGEEAYAIVSTENATKCELKAVNIPASVEVDGVTYPVTIIANGAFRNNSVVEEVTTPSTIKDIYEHAFREMTALKKVTLKASADFKHFRDAEFWGNKALVSIDMSGCVGLTGIGDGGTYDDTFTGCTSLEEVILPEGIEYIGTRAFFECSKLGDIENLDFTNVTYVGFKAFWGPKISGDVILSENATYVGDHAFRETNITSIVMRMGSASTQASMDDATFYNCKNLKYVVLPDNIQVIGSYTFQGCASLEYVVLGGNVQEFSTTETFKNCSALKAIIYKGESEAFQALPGVSALGTVEYKPFSEYVHGTLPSTRTVYYGAVTCGECNGILSEAGYIFTDLLSEIKVGQECIHCDNETVSETYAPVFTDLGYSTANINGYCSIVQGFKIDYTSLEIYNTNFENSKIGAFGVLAAVDNNVESVAFDENGNALAGVINAEIGTGSNYFEIKVAALPENGMLDENTAYTDIMLHMCAYANVGDKIYYISEDYVGTELGAAVSYNSLK